MSIRRSARCIAQRRAAECGAACLAIVARSYGRPVSLRLCRRFLPSGTQASVADLICAATRIGLHASAYRTTCLSVYRELNTPAVIHLDGGHFVVLVRLTNDEAEVIDPALGKVRIGAEMRRRFSGVVLAFRPATDREGARSRRLAIWFDDIVTPFFLWFWRLGDRAKLPLMTRWS